jgi:CRISPR/Cas system-associated exonuclease Cas4 (RecB family)
MTEHLAFGNALHLALEKAFTKLGFDLKQAIHIYLSEFRRIINEDEVFITFPKKKKYEAEGVEILEVFNYGIIEGKIPTTSFESEKEFKLPFEEEIVVVGKIDRLDKEGEDYIVTDYKSGSKEPDQWFLDHDLQFTTYAWAVQELYGRLPKRLVWHHLRNGKQLVTYRTQRDVDELKTMLHNALQMNRMGIRYRVYHSQVCNWCEFKGDTCDDRELEERLVAQRNEIHDRLGVAESGSSR